MMVWKQLIWAEKKLFKIMKPFRKLNGFICIVLAVNCQPKSSDFEVYFEGIGFYFIFSGCFLYHLYKAKLNKMGIIILSVIRKKNNLMILKPENISTRTK